MKEKHKRSLDFKQMKGLFFSAVKKIQDLKKKQPSFIPKKTPKDVKGVSIVKEGNIMHVYVAPASVAKGTAMVLLVLALAYSLMQISDILILFFVAFLFTAGLDRSVTNLKIKYHIPRALSVIILYIAILSVLAVTLSNLAPLVADQLASLSGKVFQFFDDVSKGNGTLPFADELAPYFLKFTESVNLDQVAVQMKESLQAFSSKLLSLSGNVWDLVIAVSNGLINTSIVLVLTFFMVVEWGGIEDFFISLFPNKHTQYIVSHLDAVKSKIGFWLRGQIMLSIGMGVLTYVGLLIIGLDYAVTIALISAIAEFVPVVGPIIALMVAIPVAANISFAMLIWTVALFILIQQIEGNIMVPLIMKKTVGLSPIIVMFAMLVGYQYLGILGMILSIPVAACLSIFVKDYTERVRSV